MLSILLVPNVIDTPCSECYHYSGGLSAVTISLKRHHIYTAFHVWTRKEHISALGDFVRTEYLPTKWESHRKDRPARTSPLIASRASVRRKCNQSFNVNFVINHVSPGPPDGNLSHKHRKCPPCNYTIQSVACKDRLISKGVAPIGERLRT